MGTLAKGKWVGMPTEREGLIKTLKTQWFIHSPQYAVYSHDVGDAPTYALFSKPEQVPEGYEVDHVTRKTKHRLRTVVYWTWREYVHGWRMRFAEPEPCGCQGYGGKWFVCCGDDAHFERMFDSAAG